MTTEQFERERRYRVSLSIAGSMLRQGMINSKDFEAFKQILIAEYAPFFGGLSSELS